MRRLFAAALLVLATAHGAVAAGEHPWDNKRINYLVEHNGRLVERGFFVRRPGSYQRRPCVITEEEKFVYGEADLRNPVRSVKIKTLYTPAGEALMRQEETVVGDPGHETITIAGGEAIFECSGHYGSPARVPAPPGVVFEITGEWLAANSPRPGQTAAVEVLDRRGRGVFTETVQLLERVGAGSPAVWLAEFASPGRPPMRARFTTDGRLTRLESEGMVYQVVSREEYDAGRIPLVPVAAAPGQADSPRSGGPAIPIGATVPAWDNFAWLIFSAAPPDLWHNTLTQSDYATVEYVGAGTNVTAIRNAPRADASAMFPMPVPPDVQPYLTAHRAIPSTDPTIIEHARMAVSDADTGRGEENVLRAVSYLAGWINQNIAVREWQGYGSSAGAALAERAADSAGHARLFAAMARSLGVPSRICQGLLAQTGQAVLHCWAEVWIGGVWIPVDTTVSRVGLPAGYILAERAGPDGVFLMDFAGFLRNPALRLNLVSAGRETPGQQLAELIVGDRRSYAFAERDWMANLYWGFALRLPPSWSGSAKLDSVEITSPDGQASVKCEAMAGDFRAGKRELDANVASLRSSLRRFRAVDSRVVSFDPDGATPALFIDFTCQQDGVNLRCRQYVLPRRQRAFRISFWAPVDQFANYTAAFDSILASFEF